MAYFTEAQVLFCLGLAAVDSEFTAALIALAGAEADAWVDEKYDDAGATDKTRSASHYAAYLLLRNRPGGLLKGVTHGGASGAPGQVPEIQTAAYHLQRAIDILRSNALNASDSFTQPTPTTSGSW